MRRCRAAAVALLGAWAALARGGPPPAAPARPDAAGLAPPAAAPYLTPDGAIAVVGYNDMAEMLRALGNRFAELHPGFRFAWNLPGTKAAPAALAAGRSAFAPMGAPLTPAQLADYGQKTGAEPRAIRVAHASLSPRALSGPLAIFVPRDSPLTALSLPEVAAVFSGTAERRGLHPCGVDAEAVLGQFFRERVLGGGSFAPAFVGFAQSAEVVRRVAADPRGIGFAAAVRATPEVKILALAERAGEAPVPLTAESLRSGRYPLDRHLLIYVRLPLDGWLREWLRFVLSPEGQEIVASGTLGYLPLSPREAAEELAKLP